MAGSRSSRPLTLAWKMSQNVVHSFGLWLKDFNDSCGSLGLGGAGAAGGGGGSVGDCLAAAAAATASFVRYGMYVMLHR